MSSSRLKIALILGSTRDERMCERVAKFVKNAVEKDHSVVTIDPLQIDFPRTQQSMNWLMKPEVVPANIQTLNEQVVGCDAIVVITPEYNWSVPPALAQIVDNIPPFTFMWKPCSIISYSVGVTGGWRGGMQVRQMMSGVGCNVTQKQMGIGVVHEALDAKGNPSKETLATEMSVILNQLVWLTRAISAYKAVEKAPPFTI